MNLTNPRRAQLVNLRSRLNAAGEPLHYYTNHADDTIPGNASAWNRKRIRVRNRINARLARALDRPQA